MKQDELKKDKLARLNPLYQMVHELDADSFRVNDFYQPDYDLFNVTDRWSSCSYFLKDFKRYAPPEFLFHAIQKNGTFVSIMKFDNHDPYMTASFGG